MIAASAACAAVTARTPRIARSSSVRRRSWCRSRASWTYWDSYAFGAHLRLPAGGPNDVYVSMGQVKKYGLRKGDAVHGTIPPAA